MAEGDNVRFAVELERFIPNRMDQSGLYGSASECIHDPVRRGHEREEQRSWQWLRQEVKARAVADEADFVVLDGDSIIADAKLRRTKRER